MTAVGTDVIERTLRTRDARGRRDEVKGSLVQQQEVRYLIRTREATNTPTDTP